MQPAVGGSLSFTYDALKRLSGQANGVYRKFYGYEKDGSNATTRLDFLSYASTDGNNLAGFTLYYDYDQRGNIAVVTSNSTSFPSAVYSYDIQGQLTQEILGGVTYNYAYDTYGNIVQVSGGASHTYTYGDEEWRDLLMAYDDEPIQYDNIGNPTSYFNGARWNFTWQKGRQLASATLGTSTYTYTYDINGIRNSKTVNGTTYNYLTQNGKVVRQTWTEDGQDKVMDFIYDNSGNPYALVYNGTTYYYILNQQGDVIRIVDTNGGTQATYTYNAWGKLMDCSGWLATTNPIRYRGYYCDTETGFYYLGSRYYDPGIGRFINADETSNLAANGDFTSLNLFAYCGNNPVSRIDNNGDIWNVVAGAVIGGLTAAFPGSSSLISAGISAIESINSDISKGENFATIATNAVVNAGLAAATSGSTVFSNTSIVDDTVKAIGNSFSGNNPTVKRFAKKFLRKTVKAICNEVKSGIAGGLLDGQISWATTVYTGMYTGSRRTGKVLLNR